MSNSTRDLGDLEKQVYVALQKNLINKVVNICEKFPDGGLHMCSIHKATVLHLTVYQQNYKLAHKLLDGLNLLYDENNLSEKLTSAVDNWGHTLLHCATISDNNDGVEIANRILNLAPNLLEKHNKSGETAIFSACRHGNLCMFKFLAEQVDFYCLQNPSDMHRDDFLRRSNDGVNVLHLSIRMRTFDLALEIVKRYPNLCKERGSRGMTALQMLARSTAAFPSGYTAKLGRIERYIYNIISGGSEEVDNDQNPVKVKVFYKPFISSCVNRMIKAREDHLKAVNLARLLVKNDDTWKDTSFPTATFKQDDDPPKDNAVSRGIVRYKDVAIEEEEQNALLLAAENGCIEIVKEILKEHPFAIEQFNEKKQNLLHLVIKNRRMKIYEYLKKHHESSLEWMRRDVDDDGNSILHMVGFLESSQSSVDAKVKYPVHQLQEDLVLLEELRKTCPKSLSYRQNKMMKTADEMLADNSKELQKEAKSWLERTTTQGIVVAGLIVTVIFAAVYQIPGGPDKNGEPNLLKKPFFRVFINTDVISLSSALTSIVLFFFIHTSSVELEQFRSSIPMKLLLSFGFLFLSVIMMMITFAATVILIVSAEKHWTKILIYLVTFVPVTVFVFSYTTLYFQLANTFVRWVCNKINSKSSLAKKQTNDQDEEQGSSHS